jgi:hypothetical protein
VLFLSFLTAYRVFMWSNRYFDGQVLLCCSGLHIGYWGHGSSSCSNSSCEACAAGVGRLGWWCRAQCDGWCMGRIADHGTANASTWTDCRWLGTGCGPIYWSNLLLQCNNATDILDSSVRRCTKEGRICKFDISLAQQLPFVLAAKEVSSS